MRPAPNPHSSTRSPSATVPARRGLGQRQRDRRRRRVAEPVDGRRGALGARPVRASTASTMRALAWWGTNRATSSAVAAGPGQRAADRGLDGPHGAAEHLAAVHPQVVVAGGDGLGAGRDGRCRRRARPAGRRRAGSPTRSLATSPAGAGRAPPAADAGPGRRPAPAAAPSPKSTAVDRSSGSTTLVMVSAPTSSAVRATPAGSSPDAGGQAVDEPGAGGVDVEGAGGDAQLGGHLGGGGGDGRLGRGGGHDHDVDVGGGDAGLGQRRRAAAWPAARSTRPGPAQRRSRMPERSTIHSSEVSRCGPGRGW